MIVFLTGASGTGKTTLVERMEQDVPTYADYNHFDDIGVPEMEELKTMVNWQEITTHSWIERLVAEENERVVILEGSANIRYIIEGFQKQKYTDYLVLLIDCEESTMVERLQQRGQPELANPDMKNWLRYLRNQATKFKVAVIDTTDIKVNEAIQQIFKKIESAKSKT